MDSALSNATRNATPTAAKRRGWATIILVLSGKFSSMNWGVCVVWRGVVGGEREGACE